MNIVLDLAKLLNRAEHPARPFFVLIQGFFKEVFVCEFVRTGSTLLLFFEIIFISAPL
ncbi:MAG TPA: hypothetical protein PLY04_00870 [bacterium]|nr:hypothetical protein [bacterium]